MLRAAKPETRRRRWQWAGVVFTLLVLWVLVVPRVGAFESRSGETVIVEADEVVDDDLYVSARTLNVNGTVNGDVIFFGQTATVNGTVTGDLVAAGQEIVIEGEVSDDARVAAYAVRVAGTLGDDLVAVGFSLEKTAASATGGDLIFAGYQALLEGTVAGNASIAGGAVEVGGTVEGDASIDVGGASSDDAPPMTYAFFPGAPSIPSVAPGLTVAENATVGGDLSYTARSRADVADGAVGGSVDFTQYVPERGPDRPDRRDRRSPLAAFARWVGRQIQRWATLLVIGLILLWLAPDWTHKLHETVRQKPLPSLGWGFVALAAFAVFIIAATIAIGLLALLFGAITLGGLAGQFITAGGLVLGAAGLSFSVTWGYVTRVIISVLLGDLVFRLLKVDPTGRRWWALILGLLIFVALTAVPVLGWLLGVVAALLGLGAIWLWGRGQFASGGPRRTSAGGIETA